MTRMPVCVYVPCPDAIAPVYTPDLASMLSAPACSPHICVCLGGTALSGTPTFALNALEGALTLDRCVHFAGFSNAKSKPEPKAKAKAKAKAAAD